MLALQSAFLTNSNHIKHLAKKDPICPLWRLYEPLAANDLPGNCPLPSWAWFMLVKDKEKPKISGQQDLSKMSLNKSKRNDLKVYKSIQQHRTKDLHSLDRAVQATDDWRRIDVPKAPIPRTIARGQDQIVGLLCRMPPCKHIRSDTCCQVDVPIVTPSGVVMRFSCLMVEVLPLDIVNKMHASSNGHVLIFGEIGAAAIRLVQRTMIIVPDPVNKILQEDLSILPAPLHMINEHSDAIRVALFGADALEPQKLIEQMKKL